MDTAIFIEIEEILNLRKNRMHLPSQAIETYKYDPKIINEINSYIKQSVEADVAMSRPLYDEIILYIKRLNNNRYIRKNGEVKEATFYQDARIDKSTWSDIKWNQRTPSKKTLLKLILALNLTHEEAEALLDRGKVKFDHKDIQDQVIEAIMRIRNKYDFTIQDIEDILFEYQEMYATENPFDCIYETPAMIAQRKGNSSSKCKLLS